MQKSKRLVLFSVLCVLTAWIAGNYSRITEDQSGFVRLVLGLLFGMIVLFRWKKPADGPECSGESWHIPVFSLLGSIMVVSGLIFHIHQVEWIGLLLLSYVSLKWAFPARYSRDVAIALFIIYWIHPIPGQIFTKLQFIMQGLSVEGSEWLLHCANVRVWSDGMIIHTGLRALGVPEACSGMRTIVTVVLYTIGIGVLFRFRWLTTLVFVFLGMVQVLFLNILRISFMVVWSSRMPVEWADQFLHDSLGAFLLVSIVLLQVETSIWKFWTEKRIAIEEAIEHDDIEAPETASVLPVFWRFLQKWAIWMLSVVLVFGIVAFVAYKRRPAHQLAMITEVVDSLLESDLDAAEKAIHEGLKLISENNGDIGSSRHLLGRNALLLVLRGRHKESIDILESLPGELSLEEKVLKSWALMAVGSPEQAVALIDELPEDVKKQPGVAVIRAEYGARRDMPEVVRDNIVPASKLHTTIRRVRSLFPYMASRELWNVIADCENPGVPYENFSYALIAIHANMYVNRVKTAAAILKQALAKWPNEPRFLDSLHNLAMLDPAGGWEDVFAQILGANLNELNVDRLASYISFSFQMHRPDLAWIVMTVLARHDQNDPSLLMAPVNFGRAWFTFRKHRVGVKAQDVRGLIDLREVYLQTRDVFPVNSFWARIPFADEIVGNSYNDIREKYVNKSLAELEKRRADGSITRRMRLSYPSVLANDSKFDEAHRVLDELKVEYPGLNRKIMLEHAKLYDRCQQWQDSYDILRACEKSSATVNVDFDLMMVNALMNMNLGICAMHVAQGSKRMFPESSRVDAAIASIWASYGFKEQAIRVLQDNEDLLHSPAMIQLLYETGRNAKADRLSKALGFKITRDTSGVIVPRVVPAEVTIMRRQGRAFSDEEIKSELKEKELELENASSEFFRKLLVLEIQWLRTNGADAASDVRQWEAAGETDIERVACVSRLGMFLAKQQKYEQAAKVFKRAAEIMPDSSIIWRILISVSEGDAAIVKQAGNACPDDPEILLASLVTRIRDEKPDKWIDELVTLMLDNKMVSVATLVRASDFMLRKKFVGPAARLAKKAVKEAEGYLPAYTIGVKCAHALGDVDWALMCALRGADHAPDPTPFYKVIATMGASDKRTSTDVVAALEYLNEHYSDEPQWAVRLGNTYFQKGDSARALNILWPVIHENLAAMDPASLMISAEAARQQGRDAEELTILISAQGKFPEDTKLLNNLVYALSRNPETLPKAVELLPVLLEKGTKDFIVYDTIAMVHLRNGDLEKAQSYMAMALENLDKNNYAAREIRLNSAELLINVGKYREARAVINELRKEQGVSQMHELRSRELLRIIEKAVSEKDVLTIESSSKQP